MERPGCSPPSARRVRCLRPHSLRDGRPGTRGVPSLAAAWAAGTPRVTVRVAAGPGEALDEALRVAPGPVVVAGSLYLVGEARARLVDDPDLRDPGPDLQDPEEA